MLLPDCGPLPQTSQTCAMTYSRTFPNCGAKLSLYLENPFPGNSPRPSVVAQFEMSKKSANQFFAPMAMFILLPFGGSMYHPTFDAIPCLRSAATNDAAASFVCASAVDCTFTLSPTNPLSICPSFGVNFQPARLSALIICMAREVTSGRNPTANTPYS